MLNTKTFNKIIVATIAAFLLYVIFALVSHAAPAPGTGGGCAKTAEFCTITAVDGSADGECVGGRSFSGARVASYREFDPEWLYRVNACKDGRYGLRAVKVLEKYMRAE